MLRSSSSFRDPNQSSTRLVFYGISAEIVGSLRLDARELDHLGPLLGVVGDKLAEVGWASLEA